MARTNAETVRRKKSGAIWRDALLSSLKANANSGQLNPRLQALHACRHRWQIIEPRAQRGLHQQNNDKSGCNEEAPKLAQLGTDSNDGAQLRWKEMLVVSLAALAPSQFKVYERQIRRCP